MTENQRAQALELGSRSFRRTQWTVLLATMFCYLFYYTGRQTFGFAIPGISQEFGISKQDLGWISAAMLWAYAIGQAINGNLADQFGGRRMMTLGAVLSFCLNWVVSLTTGYRQMLLAWGANGFVQSMGWAPGSRVLSNWWDRRYRGRVYGAYVFAAGMSSVLAFGTSSLILALHLDWRWIFRAPVVLLLVGGLVYYLLVRDRPEDLGFPPLDADQDPKLTVDLREAPTHQVGILARYLEVLSQGRFLLACLAIGFQSYARYALLIWVPVHMLGPDWKSDVYGKWISLALPLGMAIGALLSGWFSDRVMGGNRSRVITLSMILAACASLAMYQSTSQQGNIYLLFLCGFFAYGPQSAFWALCPDLLGPKRAGTGTGVMDAFAYLFAGLGEPLTGWLIETNWNASLRGQLLQFGEPFAGWVNEANDNHTGILFLLVAASCLASALLASFVRR